MWNKGDEESLHGRGGIFSVPWRITSCFLPEDILKTGEKKNKKKTKKKKLKKTKNKKNKNKNKNKNRREPKTGILRHEPAWLVLTAEESIRSRYLSCRLEWRKESMLLSRRTVLLGCMLTSKVNWRRWNLQSTWWDRVMTGCRISEEEEEPGSSRL